MSLSMDNAGVISEFRDHWDLHYKSAFIFPAVVCFESEKAPDAYLTCKVRLEITGRDENNIAIFAEGDDLDENVYHTGFSASWQRYSFDRSSGTLRVTGNSDKMGKYECTIAPK